MSHFAALLASRADLAPAPEAFAQTLAREASAETLAADELPCSISVDSTDDYLPAVLNQIRLYLQAPRCL